MSTDIHAPESASLNHLRDFCMHAELGLSDESKFATVVCKRFFHYLISLIKLLNGSYIKVVLYMISVAVCSLG